MMEHAQVLAATRRWLDRAVIGLNLCPFAKAVYVKNQVGLHVAAGRTAHEVLGELGAQLQQLVETDPAALDTSLLILPEGFEDFLVFNALAAQGERLIRKRGLEGEIQLATFHPRYQFAGTDEDDIGNFSNRSPYPVLHLLREASIARAVQAIPDPAAIYEANIETLRRLGREGWDALGVGPAA